MIITLKNFKQSLFVLAAVFSFGAIVLTTSPAYATTCVQGNWTYGSSGRCVSDIQDLLNKEGGYLWWANFSYLSVDGQFGPLTKAQVKAFQAYTGNQQDGQVGPHTWSSLCSKAAEVISAYNELGAYKAASALNATAYDAGCGI